MTTAPRTARSKCALSNGFRRRFSALALTDHNSSRIRRPFESRLEICGLPLLHEDAEAQTNALWITLG
jgi:hypothetical protein